MNAAAIQTVNPALTQGSPLDPKAHGEDRFGALLQMALTQPGIVNQAYRAFQNYSMGNQLLAAHQLMLRGLPLSPIASFNAWKEKGRIVRKGQKAIALYMPVTVKRKDEAGAVLADGEAGAGSFSLFMLRNNWFSLDQTDGEAFAPEVITPLWDAPTAMAALDVQEEKFQHVRGNLMGYARGRTIAVSPLNPFKHKTRFHELAHIVLGHTADAEMVDGAELQTAVMEAEAESVAYLLCALLDLPGQAESRNYIQGWLAGFPLPEKSIGRIFGAADRIMKAGQPVSH